MVFTIISVIVALVIAFVLLVLFSPLLAGVHFSLGAAHAGGSLRGSFLHPRVISIVIDLASQDVVVRLFGRSIGRKASEPAKKEDSPVSGRSTSTLSEDAAIHPLPEKESGIPTAHDIVRSDVKVALPVPPTEFSVRSGDTGANLNSTTAVSAAGRSGSADESTAPPPQQRTSASEEKVAAAKEKQDNWFERLRYNRYVFFIGNHTWRRKLLQWIARVVRAVFRLVRFDCFAVSVRGGVEDPMLTGVITGLHRAVAGALAAKPPFAISYEPVFMANHFECTGTIGLRTSVVQLLLPLLIAVATFPSLHTLYLWWYFTRLRKKRSQKVVA